MPEAVRLVIWDLDEVLWKGTLTEGGIRYDDNVHRIVIELTQRGIMNSICSNNDPAQVRALLVGNGLWDYFILPSIAWQPKGPRLQAIVDAAQLRPESILFIDDNATNLAEAQHFVPGIQVADERIVPDMLEDPLFRGKDDRGLTRLQQYKVLERRQIEQQEAGADRAGFLRASHIRVSIEYDVDAHIDRAVELINRTNQLNFTKQRLPEDQAEARAALRTLLGYHWIQAGLVRVTDKYGDYGYCGFYMISNAFSGDQLLHFCFSCRILHMGVEQWLYHRLGQPQVMVLGEVLTDLHAPGPVVDWISIGTGTDDVAGHGDATFACVVARGGCDISAIAHYCRPVSEEIHEELTTVRRGIEYRTDHSLLLAAAARGSDARSADVFRMLGYEPQDLTSRLFQPWAGRAVMLLSFFGDAYMPIYRHRPTGVRVPILLPTGIGDLAAMSEESLADHPAEATLLELRQVLRDRFDYEGLIGEDMFKDSMRDVLSALGGSEAYILRSESSFERHGQVTHHNPQMERLNLCLDSCIHGFPRVQHISLRTFVKEPEEQLAANHFDRKVYFRFFQALRDGRLGKFG